MMTRAWLILADILVTLVLFISLILFHLNPISKTASPSTTKIDENLTLDQIPLPGIDLSATLTLEDLVRMGQVCNKEPYMIENKFLSRSLKEGLSELSAKIGDPIFIRIFKEESLLEVWIRTDTEYKHLKDYAICAFSGALGPKLKEGDRQAPEGFYKVKKQHLNPNSKFHLSFNLGYPNAYDRAHGRTGSFLMVHGNCVSIGCYAMTDEKIEEIYELLEAALASGQSYVQVHAYPFRMTEQMMSLFSDNEWFDFWVNLKEGYDYFEAQKNPAHIEVKDKQYMIHESHEL